MTMEGQKYDGMEHYRQEIVRCTLAIHNQEIEARRLSRQLYVKQTELEKLRKQLADATESLARMEKMP